METNPTKELPIIMQVGDFVIENKNGFFDISYRGKDIATLQKISGSVGIFCNNMYGEGKGDTDIIEWFHVRARD